MNDPLVDTAISVDKPRCPVCQSAEPQLISLYGTTLLVSQFYCPKCHNVFEGVRRLHQDGCCGHRSLEKERDAGLG